MEEQNEILQQKLSSICVQPAEKPHSITEVPDDFTPWGSGISPSALYNCSLPLRKKIKIKTPETKWVSIKRWTTITLSGLELPDGVFMSIKRFECFKNDPEPHFAKTEYILMLMPYGNVYFQTEDGDPLTEDMILSEQDGELYIQKLLNKDALNPLTNYFKSVYDYVQKHPDQIGIHLRRKVNQKP